MDFGEDLRKQKDKEVIKPEEVGKLEDVLKKEEEHDPHVVERRTF